MKASDVWDFLVQNSAVIVVVIFAILLFVALGVNKRANEDAVKAEGAIESSDIESVSEEVVKPYRVRDHSNSVAREVEASIDEAVVPTDDEVAAGDIRGDAAAHRSDDAFRGGIERMRDKASRY